LKIEVADSSETLVTAYDTVWCHNSEDQTVKYRHLFAIYILHFYKRGGTCYKLIKISVMSETEFFRTLTTKFPLVKGQQRVIKKKVYIYQKIPERTLIHYTKLNNETLAMRPRQLGHLTTNFFYLFWFVRLLALRPLLAYCASLG
jgi:hypothetical protein